MRIMVVGADGQLGADIVRQFQDKSDLIPLTYEDGDIVNPEIVQSLLEKHQPNVIINTAAFHNVPKCENEPIRAFEVNALGARNLAVTANKIQAKLVPTRSTSTRIITIS